MHGRNALKLLRVDARVRRFRFMIILAVASVATWLLGCAAVGVIAVEGALHVPHLALTARNQSQAVTMARRENAILANAEIIASDGAVLRAWSIRARGGNGTVVILMHGQGDNRVGMLGPAEMLLRHGYSVLLPDARGHGESDGAITTYGVLEADDVHRWSIIKCSSLRSALAEERSGFADVELSGSDMGPDPGSLSKNARAPQPCMIYQLLQWLWREMAESSMPRRFLAWPETFGEPRIAG